MEIKQRFVVEHPMDAVWRSLSDVPLVASCLPGAEITEQLDEQRYKGRMRIKLGPIAAAFAGEAKVTRDEAAHTGAVEGAGADGKSGSRAKARMSYRLVPEQGGKATAVEMEADIALTGALAQFGRSSIINDIAARLTEEFARTLHGKLNDLAAGERGGAAPVSPPSEPQAVDAGRLILSALRRRILSFLRRLLGRTE
jgi:carbon monoxide dehydrogenase subunit G